MCCHLLVKHQLCVPEMQITKSVLQPDPNTVSCVSERAEVLLPSQQRSAVVLGVNTSFLQSTASKTENANFHNTHCRSAIRYLRQ